MYKETSLLYYITKDNFDFLKSNLKSNPDINTIIFNRSGDNEIFSVNIDNPFYEKSQSKVNIVVKWMEDIIDIIDDNNWDTEDELGNMIKSYANAVIASVERD